MFTVVRYEEADAADWDELVAEAPMATFLHSRRFLSYHGDRFAERSVLLRDDTGAIVGALPAAVDPVDDLCVLSHPGSTFGGLVHAGALGGSAMLTAIETVTRHYSVEGFARLRYKAVPHVYHRRPSEDDVYALVRAGARLYRADLSTAIDLEDRGRRSTRRQRGERKARKLGVELVGGNEQLGRLWPVLEQNLASRHGTRPAHTLQEIELLASRFPESIDVVAAELEGELIGGVVLLITPRVVHAQYTASNKRAREANVLDLVFEHCIERAASEGARYFDFGISTEDGGRRLNADLNRFKTEFGGGGVVHEFYELHLRG